MVFDRVQWKSTTQKANPDRQDKGYNNNDNDNNEHNNDHEKH